MTLWDLSFYYLLCSNVEKISEEGTLEVRQIHFEFDYNFHKELFGLFPGML